MYSFFDNQFYNLVSSADPDEMPHNAAFHQGLPFVKVKKELQTNKKQYFF